MLKHKEKIMISQSKNRLPSKNVFFYVFHFRMQDNARKDLPLLQFLPDFIRNKSYNLKIKNAKTSILQIFLEVGRWLSLHEPD